MTAFLDRLARRLSGTKARDTADGPSTPVGDRLAAPAVASEHRRATWPDPLPVHAWVVAHEAFASALRYEWRQTSAPRSASEEMLSNDPPDLVLVGDGALAVWERDDLTELLDQAGARSVPRIGFFSDGDEALSLAAHLDGVLVPESAVGDVERVGGAEVIAVPASVSPHQLVLVPPPPARRRSAALAVAEGEALPDEAARRLKAKPSADPRPTSPRAQALSDARGLVSTSRTPPHAVAEAALAGTPVLRLATEESADERLPGHVVNDAAALRSEAVALLNQDELVDREGHRLRRSVLRGGTYRDRLEVALQAAGLPLAPRDRSVSFVVPTNREHELDNVLANAARQRDVDLELVLVLHGVEVDESDLRMRGAELGLDNITVVGASSDLTLGACMNLGVDAAQGRFIAKVDDDNYYGPQFAADLVDAFRYTDAQITGKWAHYVWLRSTGAVVLRYPDSEHRYERRVQGGSMMFDRDLVRRVRFSDIPRAVDSDILDRAAAEGARIYSADRYNFVSVRGTDRLSHTWTVDDSTFFTARGDLRFYGDPRPHVDV